MLCWLNTYVSVTDFVLVRVAVGFDVGVEVGVAVGAADGIASGVAGCHLRTVDSVFSLIGRRLGRSQLGE